MTGPSYHGWTHRPKRVGGSDPDPPLGHYEIKVFADPNALDGNLPASATDVSIGDGKFVFEIPEDLDGTRLVVARAFLSTVGAGDCVVQISNITQAADMLTDPITIDTGDLSSKTSASPVVIDTSANEVADGDQIRIDVDTASGQGLGVILMFA